MIMNNKTERRYGYFKDISLTTLSLVLTVAACILLGQDMLSILADRVSHGTMTEILSQGGFILVIGYLLLGSFVYHLTRFGQLKRHHAFQPPSREALESVYDSKAPSLAVLIPSYKEDTKVITKTLLSAALLDYPAMRVVLLIDNPPDPDDVEDRNLLAQTRALPRTVKTLLDGPRSELRDAYNRFINRSSHGRVDLHAECACLSGLYRNAAAWLKDFAAGYPVDNHEDRWFVQEILLRPAREHEQRAAEFAGYAALPEEGAGIERIRREYTRLSRLFQVEITSFERKRYVNLSHEPNKAMNLNSYLGLMGHHVAEKKSADGLSILTGTLSPNNAYIPDADFVITLDADSLLLSDYALQLISVIAQPGNERLAVVQTPYSAFPDATSKLERMAGATTDIQYLIHQGFTQYNATFWVGANALLRKRALEDIAVKATERGHSIRKFIQDRTVIEDTESSVDLVEKNWRLFNYPQRLAYSATPPDFGSLLIQRRRWANGGLVILPKFLRYITAWSRVPCRLSHGLLGGHYLTSLAGVNIGFMILLLWPFEEAMRTLWLPVATLPYFALYASDLKQTGYRYGDVFRIYALNLLLVPVNLGGVFKSLQQIVTGKRTPFGRTPKVADRTAIPLLYLAAVYGCLGYCLASLVMDMQAARWMHAVFAAFNGSVLLYAITVFIGHRAAAQDIKLALSSQRVEPVAIETVVTCVPASDAQQERLAG
jgi:cellulose synthase/poly-beta-1,6-N-acetylglucosamine synthase-like glycosyltransferase